MATITVFIRGKGAVKLSEEGDYVWPYFIDVNSYQTPGFPASAINVLFADPHASTFSTLTDQLIQSTGNFMITQFKTYAEPILAHTAVYGKHIVHTRGSLYLDRDRYTGDIADVDVVFTPKSLTPLSVKVDQAVDYRQHHLRRARRRHDRNRHPRVRRKSGGCGHKRVEDYAEIIHKFRRHNFSNRAGQSLCRDSLSSQRQELLRHYAHY